MPPTAARSSTRCFRSSRTLLSGRFSSSHARSERTISSSCGASAKLRRKQASSSYRGRLRVLTSSAPSRAGRPRFCPGQHRRKPCGRPSRAAECIRHLESAHREAPEQRCTPIGTRCFRRRINAPQPTVNGPSLPARPGRCSSGRSWGPIRTLGRIGVCGRAHPDPGRRSRARKFAVVPGRSRSRGPAGRGRRRNRPGWVRPPSSDRARPLGV